LINPVACPSHAAVIRYRSTPPDLAERKLEQLDADFRRSIRARDKRTTGERVNHRDFGFYFPFARNLTRAQDPKKCIVYHEQNTRSSLTSQSLPASNKRRRAFKKSVSVIKPNGANERWKRMIA
jgi:hypothetical protein